MTNNDWDECFLLHHRPHGETSLIVDVFTKKNGKMSFIAKGAKKPKSKFFGYLTPFTKLKITYTGRSELKTLTNIDRDFSESTNSLSKTSYSLLYINELLIRLLPKDAVHEDLFLLYEKLLRDINLDENLELTLRRFELDMLDTMGYGFDYEYDINNNEPIDIDSSYRFVSERGFRKSKNATFLGKDIINLKNRNLKDVPLKELKEITKKAIMNAVENPRKLNDNLVSAQQARRVLDRLVGYELSPVLWRKVKTGLSAGRVQSVSVRLIVEKEREIKNFQINSIYKSTGTFKNSNGIIKFFV